MSDHPGEPPSYKPGDIVNHHVLGEDGRWHLLAPPEPVTGQVWEQSNPRPTPQQAAPVQTSSDAVASGVVKAVLILIAIALPIGVVVFAVNQSHQRDRDACISTEQGISELTGDPPDYSRC